MAREDPSMPWQPTDPFYDFEVIIYRQNDCTPGFRNVPSNDMVYLYEPQMTALTIEFPDLDDTECDYVASIHDTTYGTSFSHSAFQFN